MIRQIAVENVETAIAQPSVDTTQQTDTEEEETAQKTTTGTDDVYTIFVSGIDNRGGIVAKSRSDVNIIVTANMTTRQLLLVSTPRDYYVPLSISNGVPDKLTHAGIYGISVCMDTLGMLYDMDINYYVRLNFDGFINIIDALGGITVESDYDFDTQNTTGYHFNQGANEVDGTAALAFARERYAFTEGDRQRGRNQMAVIKGVIDKALSPELLKNYSSILSSVQDCFETNISYETIARLLQKQLATGGSWNVVSYSVDGTGDTQKPYSMSSTAYVMVPDYTTVEHAKELMQQVRDGEIISQE
jgi:LCP family protein required for cell wall assembly